MKKISLLLFSILLFAIACKKDSSASPASSAIAGTWKFNGLNAQTLSIVDENNGSLDEKTVTTSDYTTTSNTGTVTFGNDGTTTGTGVGYSTNFNATSDIYENGVLTQTINTPYSFTVPASNSMGTYLVIGTDSVYFSSGSLVSNGNSSANGGRFTIKNDTLTININYVKDSTFTGGYQDNSALTVVTLTK